MKRRICTLAAILLLLLSLSVSAAEPRFVTPRPSLTFDGTTATCSVNIVADSSSDNVSATVKLWQGNTCLKTWTDSDTYYLRFSETYSSGITSGKTYKMTVNYTVAGKTYPQLEVSALCRG